MTTMTYCRILVMVLLLAVGMVDVASSLSEKEAMLFRNSGKYGGSLNVKIKNETIEIVSNGVPDHALTTTPRNKAFFRHTYNFPKVTFPLTAIPGCLPWGPIGITLTGVPLYHPVDVAGNDKVDGDHAALKDNCNAVMEGSGYLYYQLPKCLYKGTVDELLGVAFDGIPIYGPNISFLNREIKSSDLDICHGRLHNGTYRYYVTSDFPYILGCYIFRSEYNPSTLYRCGRHSMSTKGQICLCPNRSNNSTATKEKESGNQVGLSGRPSIGSTASSVDLDPNGSPSTRKPNPLLRPVPRPFPVVPRPFPGKIPLPKSTTPGLATLKPRRTPVPRPFPGKTPVPRPFPVKTPVPRPFPGKTPLPITTTPALATLKPRLTPVPRPFPRKTPVPRPFPGKTPLPRPFPDKLSHLVSKHTTGKDHKTTLKTPSSMKESLEGITDTAAKFRNSCFLCYGLAIIAIFFRLSF